MSNYRIWLPLRRRLPPGCRDPMDAVTPAVAGQSAHIKIIAGDFIMLDRIREELHSAGM
jgi:hypothetical protein